jgi:RES domain-containing protein
MTPDPVDVDWPSSHRLVASIHPPIDLFEDVADPADWEALARLEARSNPRVLENVGVLARVPIERRVAGPGASWVMAPFVHASPRFPGRFHDGTFGAWYAADRLETAIAEVAHHRSRLYRASGEAPGWFSQARELVAPVHARLHDLRGAPAFADCLDPDDYGPSQALARALREAGSDGLVFPSVRDAGGTCVALLWPDLVGRPRQGRHLAWHFDGQRIDLARDEGSGAIWRLGADGR